MSNLEDEKVGPGILDFEPSRFAQLAAHSEEYLIGAQSVLTIGKYNDSPAETIIK